MRLLLEAPTGPPKGDSKGRIGTDGADSCWTAFSGVLELLKVHRRDAELRPKALLPNPATEGTRDMNSG